MTVPTVVPAISAAAVLALVSVVGPAPLAAQSAISAGEIVRGTTGVEPATWRFEADGAGVLTAVVRSTDGSDLVLVVTDADGQPLRDGRADQDLGGDVGAEQLAATLPRAGSYRIRVEAYGGGAAAFSLGVSWLPHAALERPADPDGSPRAAIPLDLDRGGHDDVIDASVGDDWDWFVVRPSVAGTLTVTTRSEDGDLVLEAFRDGNFIDSAERSDQDLEGESGSEAVTLVVSAGQEIHLKVSTYSGGARVGYRIQAGLIAR